MHLVKRTFKFFPFCFIVLFISTSAFSQENSPFSRYGLGDIYPQQHIASRGMGGLSSAFSSNQAINTVNPASYGAIGLVTYDFGLTIDSRTLLSKSPADRYGSTNFLPSYLQLGVPLTKSTNINKAALVFGIRPATRINYSVTEGKRIYYDSLGTSDSVQELHEGNGGLNQVFLGLGKSWKNKRKPSTSLSLGFNFGYEWGTKFVSNKTLFPSDSSYENWYRSNATDSTHYWGVFLSPGIMASFTLKQMLDHYTNKMDDAIVLVIGGSGTIEQNLNASRDITRQTFYYQSDGQEIPVDSIYKSTGNHGKITVPLSFNGGFMLNKMLSNGLVKKWGVGADYSFTPWTKYRDYGEPDQLNDSWFIRVGAEFTPNPFSVNVFNRSVYRVGYYRGMDFQNADGNGYKVQAFTLGYSFNLRKYRSYDNQYTMINTAIEFGKRGSAANNVTENFFKFSLGLSLSDIWFIKRKYD